MAIQYSPNASSSTETIQLPEPGDPGVAESVNVAFRRLADRLKGAVSVYDPVNKIVQSLSTLLVTDTKPNGIAIEGTATGTDGAVGMRGIGQYGVWGQTVGSTLLHAAVVGKALSGLAMGVYGESVGGPALEGNGTSAQFALRLRGVVRWALSAGVSDAAMNPASSNPIQNMLVPKNVPKAWGEVHNGVLLDGFNIQSVQVAPPEAGGTTAAMKVNFAAPMANANYAVITSSSQGQPGWENGSTNPVEGAYHVYPYHRSAIPTNLRPAATHFFLRQILPISGPVFNGQTNKDMGDSSFSFVVFGTQALPAN